MVLKIHIVYCGAWGYASRYRQVKSDLERVFGDKIEVSGEGTPGVTGFFEIQIGGSPDKLAHSKKNGDGFVDTDAKKKAVEDAIKAALEA